MENFARMGESTNECVVAHAPETREAIRTGHDNKLIVRAELGVADDIRVRKPEQKLTLRQLPDAGGAFSLIGHLQGDGASFRLACEQKFSARAEENLLDFIRVSQPGCNGLACFQAPHPSGPI